MFTGGIVALAERRRQAVRGRTDVMPARWATELRLDEREHRVTGAAGHALQPRLQVHELRFPTVNLAQHSHVQAS